jgi:hypothetical protein
LIATPIGKQSVIFEIAEEHGTIRGTAASDAETVPFEEVVLTGNRLTWSQRITKPIRLNLKFDVTFDGDTLSGISKAGLLPSSAVSGVRLA